MTWIRLTKGFDLLSTAAAWMRSMTDFYNRKGIVLAIKHDPIGSSYYIWRTTVWNDHNVKCCSKTQTSGGYQNATVIEYLQSCDASSLWDGVGDPPPDNYAIGALERASRAEKRKARVG